MAQTPVLLGQPANTLSEQFSQVRGIRELSDGRVIVSDWIEQRVVLIDAAFTRVTQLGRTGNGPDEFRLPAALYPMAADTTLLVDMGNARLSVLRPDGRIARTIPASRPGLGSPLGVDNAGRFYFAEPVWSRTTSSLPPDSVEIFSFDARTSREEKIATIKGMTMARRDGPRTTPGFPMVAFAAQDLVRVLPTGGVVIVRSGDYSIQRISGTGRSAGPPYRYRTDPVRPADKTAFVENFVASAPTSGKGPDGGMGHSPAMSASEIAQMVATNEFAERLPMFERAVLAPDGELWVMRGRHPQDAPVYDRFNSAGVRVEQVRLPPAKELHAVGARYLYVVVTANDGVQRLERHLRR